ncbi:hypothetical protein [Brevundimonas sp. NPDC046655]|uniref:hypothetical protein n=1 Tax=unclassified Brevundimonas TaxID=2622653 RepID=UPI00384DF37D
MSPIKKAISSVRATERGRRGGFEAGVSSVKALGDPSAKGDVTTPQIVLQGQAWLFEHCCVARQSLFSQARREKGHCPLMIHEKRWNT